MRGELGERDGEDGEIDAGDAEAEGEKADDRARTPPRPAIAASKAEPRADAEMHEQRRRT